MASFLVILTSYLATCSTDFNRTYLRTHVHEYGRVTAHDEVCMIRLTFRSYSLTFVTNDVHDLMDGLHVPSQQGSVCAQISVFGR